MFLNSARFSSVLKLALASKLLQCGAVLRLAGGLLALAASLLLPTMAQAQTFLDFSGTPSLAAGTSLTQGAVYRYANVIPGIDALVTLAQFNGTLPQLLNLDDNTSFQTRFQPVITCAGTQTTNLNSECYVKFDFAFVQAGTSTPATMYGLVASAQDVDGNSVTNGVREFVEFTGASSVTLGTVTTTLVAGTAVAGGVRYNQTSSNNVQNGIGIGNQYEVYAHYTTPITGLSIIGGNIIGSAGCDNTAVECRRQNSYTFFPIDSDVPSLTVRKVSNGGTGTFTFTGNNGWATQPVTTTVAGSTVTSQSEALLSPNTATTLTELAPAGFSLQSITCTGLAAGGTATPTINGVNGGSVLLNAAATAPGTVVAPTNIICTFTNRKIAANLAITKTDGTATAVAGSTINYTITATNTGPDTAAGATVQDTPSAGLNCTTVTCSSTAAGMCPAASFPFANLNAGILISPNFPVGATATLVVTCGVRATGQ
jgi:uncharacterized repeat protein (TIGR01451 family)